MHFTQWDVFWALVIVLAVAGAAYWGLRWLVFRMSARLASAAEARLAAALAAGSMRAGAGRPAAGALIDPERRRRYFAQLEWLAWLMDGVIPLPLIGGVGLDPILGLVPVAGDVLSLMVSSFVLIRAAQLGAPREVLSRLVAIQIVDLLVGVVPLVGDLADAGYHANERSVAILREWMRSGR